MTSLVQIGLLVLEEDENVKSLQPLSREGSLLCHGCYDTGPQSTWSHPDDRYVQMPPTTSKEH